MDESISDRTIKFIGGRDSGMYTVSHKKGDQNGVEHFFKTERAIAIKIQRLKEHFVDIN